jgi:hypothetical protein
MPSKNSFHSLPYSVCIVFEGFLHPIYLSRCQNSGQSGSLYSSARMTTKMVVYDTPNGNGISLGDFGNSGSRWW